ncbi:MAG: hypothetical protein D6701_04160 [Gemmatimonadetes bacterium]|nr:MAG: hypothetical protein D6701_04160 [Gemmatimonadota bacterium]
MNTRSLTLSAGTRTAAVLGAALALSLSGAGAVHAQGGSDAAGWLAWTGCWQPADAPSEAGVLCARPLPGGAVEFVTVVEGSVAARDTVRADGRRHDVRRDDCAGWEEGRFSSDGSRVFVESVLRCEDGTERRTRGLLSLASPEEWLDVRVVDVGAGPATLVQWYRPARDAEAEALAGLDVLSTRRRMDVRAARAGAAGAIDGDDVVEAVRYLPAEAVEAWIAERGERFALDGERLVRLADAGVPPEVIDVMVAVSYPGKFHLAEGAVDGEYAAVATGGRGGYADDPFDDTYDGYDRYDRRRRYGYTRFGFGSYGYRYGYGFGFGRGLFYDPFFDPYFGFGFGYRPTIVVVDRGGVAPERGHGRVERGSGYRSSGSGGVGRTTRGRARPARAQPARAPRAQP